MTFIVTLIGLLIERFFDWSHLRKWSWFKSLQDAISKRFPGKSAYITLALTVIPLVLIIALIESALSGLLFGFIKFLFKLFVFLYCLGPKNLWADSFACINAIVQGDKEFAMSKLKSAFNISDINQAQSLHQYLLNSIFIEANRRVFAVLFWFVIAGPVGAVFYRAIVLSANDGQGQDPTSGIALSARKIESILDWIPVRLFTFLFALGGHFMQVLSVWRKQAVLGLSSNETLLTECGVAALHIDENKLPEDGLAERQAISLLDRSFVISLVIIAIISLLW